MRNFLRILLTATCTLTTLAQTQSVRQSFVVTISTDKPIIREGSEVSITVHLKNISNRELDLSANINDLTGVDPNYTYDVRDSSGDLAPRKVYKHPELATGHAVFRTIRPGESIADTEPIGRLFDMSKTGKYFVQVSRRASDDEKDGVVKSNKITLTVIP